MLACSTSIVEETLPHSDVCHHSRACAKTDHSIFVQDIFEVVSEEVLFALTRSLVRNCRTSTAEHNCYVYHHRPNWFLADDSLVVQDDFRVMLSQNLHGYLFPALYQTDHQMVREDDSIGVFLGDIEHVSLVLNC